METTKWTWKAWRSPIGETGDSDSGVTLTNGKEILNTSGDEMEDHELDHFCSLLDAMPDLWSQSDFATKFEIRHLTDDRDRLKAINAELVEALVAIVFATKMEKRNVADPAWSELLKSCDAAIFKAKGQ